MKNLIVAMALIALAQTGLAAGAIEERAPLEKGATLEVVNVSGSVEITGWRRNEIEVLGELGEEAEELIFEADSGRALVKVEHKNRDDRKERRYGASGTRLVIKVPHETVLNIRSVSANVTVQEINGNQRIRAVSGSINTGLRGEEAELRTVSGDIVATGHGKVEEVELYSVSGDIKVTGLAGDVSAEAVSGDLDLSGSGLRQVRLKTVSGDIGAELGLAKNARVHMQSVSGDIEGRLPGNYEAEYELTSHSGDIAGLFGNEAKRKSKYSPGQELIFTNGNSKARVRANTLSGDIELVPDL